MESTASLVLLFLIAYLVYANGRREAVRLTPATASDWYVVFDVNAEKKVLGLWFYPVVGFQVVGNETIAVTSRPDYTAKLAISRPVKKVSDDIGGLSLSYARWYRDGAPFDERGNPEYQDSADFCEAVVGYLQAEFKLCLATVVPVFYQGQIHDAVARSKQL